MHVTLVIAPKVRPCSDRGIVFEAIDLSPASMKVSEAKKMMTVPEWTRMTACTCRAGPRRAAEPPRAVVSARGVLCAQKRETREEKKPTNKEKRKHGGGA